MQAEPQDAPQQDVHRADPRYRRRILAALGASMLVGALLLWGLQAWLDGTAGAAVDAASHHALLAALLASAAISLALLLGAFGAWLWQLAGRIERENRFPPSQLRTVRDMPVLTGPHARRQARAHRLIAAAVFAMAVAVAGWGVAAWLAFGR